MLDRTGRELKVGQAVDYMAMETLIGRVVKVEDGGLVGPNGQVQPGCVLLQVMIPIQCVERCPVYIVRDAQAKAEESGVTL